jgi:hypothetical protein
MMQRFACFQSINQFNRMFPHTPGFSPISDKRGDDTVHIISTPFFMTPHQEDSTTVDADATENVFRRLNYSSDWTTDSEPEPEPDTEIIDISRDDDDDEGGMSSNPFVWSATP